MLTGKSAPLDGFVVDEASDFQEFVRIAGLEKNGIRLLLLQHEPNYADATLEQLCSWTPKDRQQLAEFRNQVAKTSWALSRFLFRRVFSSSFGYKGRVEPELGPYGKPYLPDSEILFNWSHCAGCVALAVARGVEVGCDVEDVQQRYPKYLELSYRHLTTWERGWLMSESRSSIRWQRFATIFVQKEAKLKAAGLGLHGDFAEVGVGLLDPPFRTDAGVCFNFGPANRYVVAVAANNAGNPLTAERRNEERGPRVDAQIHVM